MADKFRRHVGISGNGKRETPEWFSQAYVQKHEEEYPLLITYDEDEDDHIMAAEEEVEMWVASDSGAVDHVCGPDSIPGSIILRQRSDGKKTKNFISASGGSIKNHGAASVNLITEEGNVINNIFQVADVCRPLHSVSKTCDQGNDMVFTDTEGIVLPKGLLSALIATLQHKVIARYPRRGGLYVAKMRARDPAMSSFARQGSDE